MTAQNALLERIRALLADTEVREVAMFGGRSVMVNGKMLVSVRKDGELLVRVSAAQDAALLVRPGASRAVMGADREMGVGWIAVSADSVQGDAALSPWIESAREYNRTVTGSAKA